MGDETRKRIDDLADGWKLDSKSPPPTPDATDTEPVPLEEPDTVRHPRVPPPIPPAAAAAAKPPRPAASPPPLRVRDDTTRSRDDPTDASGEDATILQIDAPGPSARPVRGARARDPVAVPRERGVIGDMRYVFAALFGVARARSELAEIERRLETERSERDQRLISVARYAVGNPDYDTPAVEQAREALAEIEERRSRHAGAAAGAEEEIAALERDRGSAHEAFETEDKRFETELQAIATKLGPLEKSAADVRKKINALKVTVAALDKRLKAEERKLVSVGKKDDPVAVEANLASMRAEREGVLGEEPALAAELDEIEPQIAGLTGSRTEIEKKRAAARDKEQTEQKRTAERIQATEARKQVEENAVEDLDRELDAALLELGERLDVDRPGEIADKLRGAEEHSIEIATLERKHIELKELVGGVDRAAFARGVGYWLLAGALVTALVIVVVMRV